MPELRVLYVTSFSADLYQASGRRLLESYRAVGAPGRLLVCHEGVPGLEKEFGVESYDLAGDKFLLRWLKDNADIIPKHLGGTLPPCRCAKRHIRHARHNPGCVQDWMRRNASRWFRKVASWRYAAEFNKIDVILWVDSDVEMRKVLPDDKIEAYFAGASVFYWRAHRPAAETGIVGFDLRKDGRRFVELLCTRYTSGRFRKDQRWDDGYQFSMIVDSRQVPTHDVLEGKKQPTNHVMTYSDVWEYLPHDKGRNSAKLNIMI